MFEEVRLLMANQYFDRHMKKVFVDRVCGKGIETFEKYLSYRYRDNCYYYSTYAILGMNDDDYLMRGTLRVKGNFIYGNGGYSHGWVEFKFMDREYVFDSMCRGVQPKEAWYEEFNPNVKFKYSKKEIVESIRNGETQVIKRGWLEILSLGMSDYYTIAILGHGKICIKGNKVKKFIAYNEPSG